MKKLIKEYKIALAFIGKVSDKNTKNKNKKIQKNINSVNKQFIDRAISINNENYISEDENNTIEVKDNIRFFIDFSNVKQEIEKPKEIKIELPKNLTLKEIVRYAERLSFIIPNGCVSLCSKEGVKIVIK